MTLVKVNRDVYPSFSRLFDDYKNVPSFSRTNDYSRVSANLPKVNIREDDASFLLELAAPGLDKKDFRIELDDNVLTISSMKSEEEKTTYTAQEFVLEGFERSFTIPDTVDSQKINASYKSGILSITLPKKEEAKPQPPKTIKIS